MTPDAEPLRIVSLLPSATEICFALGLGNHVVGVSHECDFPAPARSRPVVTRANLDATASSAAIDRQVKALSTDGLSLYAIDDDRLRALRPSLIITQDTCRVCAVSLDDVRAAVAQRLGGDVAILSLSPSTLADVLGDIERVGRATGKLPAARDLVADLRERLTHLQRVTAALPRPRVLLLEWLAPAMVGGHWTPELIRLAGGDPVLGHDGAPTTPETWARIAACDPDVVLIAPCGFRIDQTRGELAAPASSTTFAPLWSLRAVRQGRAFVIDGNAHFNRPGPRLIDSAEIAARAIHPNCAVNVPYFADSAVALAWPSLSCSDQ